MFVNKDGSGLTSLFKKYLVTYQSENTKITTTNSTNGNQTHNLARAFAPRMVSGTRITTNYNCFVII